MSIWSELTEPMVDSLRARAQAAADATGADVAVEVSRGRPADALMELSEQADLLVIGSRRWGVATRVLLGSTGEALLHDASCPVLVVPRWGRSRLSSRRAGFSERSRNRRSCPARSPLRARWPSAA